MTSYVIYIDNYPIVFPPTDIDTSTRSSLDMLSTHNHGYITQPNTASRELTQIHFRLSFYQITREYILRNPFARELYETPDTRNATDTHSDDTLTYTVDVNNNNNNNNYINLNDNILTKHNKCYNLIHEDTIAPYAEFIINYLFNAMNKWIPIKISIIRTNDENDNKNKHIYTFATDAYYYITSLTKNESALTGEYASIDINLTEKKQSLVDAVNFRILPTQVVDGVKWQMMMNQGVLSLLDEPEHYYFNISSDNSREKALATVSDFLGFPSIFGSWKQLKNMATSYLIKQLEQKKQTGISSAISYITDIKDRAMAKIESYIGERAKNVLKSVSSAILKTTVGSILIPYITIINQFLVPENNTPQLTDGITIIDDNDRLDYSCVNKWDVYTTYVIPSVNIWDIQNVGVEIIDIGKELNNI